MIINPIYLNSKNSEENDWNPYVMEEDKMLDLTNYTLCTIPNSSNYNYDKILYGATYNSYIKVNTNTTLILWSPVSFSNKFKFIGYNSAGVSSFVTETGEMVLGSNNCIKIKLPSSFNGKYLGIYNTSNNVLMYLAEQITLYIKDYDT